MGGVAEGNITFGDETSSPPKKIDVFFHVMIVGSHQITMLTAQEIQKKIGYSDVYICDKSHANGYDTYLISLKISKKVLLEESPNVTDTYQFYGMYDQSPVDVDNLHKIKWINWIPEEYRCYRILTEPSVSQLIFNYHGLYIPLKNDGYFPDNLGSTMQDIKAYGTIPPTTTTHNGVPVYSSISTVINHNLSLGVIADNLTELTVSYFAYNYYSHNPVHDHGSLKWTVLHPLNPT